MQTGIIQGGDILVFIDVSGTPTAIAHQETCTIDHKTTFRERRTKEKGKEKFPDEVETTISVTGLTSYDGYNYFDLRAKQLAMEAVLIKYSPEPGDSGDKYEEGNFFIESLKRSDNSGEDSKMDVTFSQKATPEIKSVV